MLPLHLIQKPNLATHYYDSKIGKNTPIVNQQQFSMYNTVRISNQFFNPSESI
jgi:hypothetical protein